MPPRIAETSAAFESSKESLRGPMPTSSLELKLYRQQSSFRFTECQLWLKRAWILHFIACILVLSFGSLTDHGQRKYIPINVDTIDEECSRGFVDVFASSRDTPGAFFCCNDDDPNNPLICKSPPMFLLFAGRLSRFPDAWLLPLFPLFFRGVIYFLRQLQGNSRETSKSDIMYAKRRFLLYVTLIQIRGWILYLLFDTLEAMIVSSISGNGEEPCWYESLLHDNYDQCQGRAMDFSDHVVLYYAQILPIALTEVLHSFVLPYWEKKDTYGKKQFNTIPIFLVLFLGNLYLVTFFGAYKTSVYFHTGIEIFVGYLVSLCIQLPLFLLQCTITFPRARDWLYGHSIS